MKKAIVLMLGLCAAESVLAAAVCINIAQDEEVSSKVTLTIENQTQQIEPSSLVSLNDLIYGAWNGEEFLLEASELNNLELDIRSTVPLLLNSFLANTSNVTCKISAPNVSVWGLTQVEKLELNSKVQIIGDVVTKYLTLGNSLDISGSLSIDNKGELKLYSTFEGKVFPYFSEDGVINNEGLHFSEDVVINKEGKLSLGDYSTVDSEYGTIENNGQIYTKSKDVYFNVNRFLNNGEIQGGGINFNVSETENNGNILLNQLVVDVEKDRSGSKDEFSITDFSSSSSDTSAFVQNGGCCVLDKAIINGDFYNSGNTTIRSLRLPKESDLLSLNGEMRADEVWGNISKIETKGNGLLELGSIVNERLNSAEHQWYIRGGNIRIQKISAKEKLKINNDTNKVVKIEQVEAPDVFVDTGNGYSSISNISGETNAFVRNKSHIDINNANINTIVTKGESSLGLEKSTVGHAILKNKESMVFDSQIEELSNYAKLEMLDSRGSKITNNAKIKLYGSNNVKNFSNYKKAVFFEGAHEIDSYYGKSSNSILKTKNKTQERIRNHDEINSRVRLKDDNTNVYIHDLRGLGEIVSKEQTYRQIMPTSYKIKGNATIETNYMPRPEVIPEYEDGNLSIKVNMPKDYHNRASLNYNDVLFEVNMNDHIFKNTGKFVAGGLDVKNASSFINKNGTICLNRYLNVDAKNIQNISDPIARENGRLVVDTSTWWVTLSYYCPATYYLMNQTNGIWVFNGDINLNSKENILNHFTTMYAGESFNAKAGKTFENKVGHVKGLGQGKSSITAENIKNCTLSPVLRQGSAYAERTAGWGWNRRTKRAYSSLAEWITQSPGAVMEFGGDTEFIGNTENFGSKISVAKLFEAKVKSISLFENEAVISSSGTELKGEEIRSSGLLFVHIDTSESKKASKSIEKGKEAVSKKTSKSIKSSDRKLKGKEAADNKASSSSGYRSTSRKSNHVRFEDRDLASSSSSSFRKK